jgi:site-specific recombinase XerD
VFRHTFSTLPVGNGEDVKTAQSLLRHANVGITLGLYTHPVGSKKREVPSKVVENDSTAAAAPVAARPRVAA